MTALKRKTIMHKLLVLLISLSLSQALCGCLSLRFYDIKPGVAVADQKLAPTPVISYRRVTVDPHVVVDAQTSGPRVTKFGGLWPASGHAFDQTFLSWNGDGP